MNASCSAGVACVCRLAMDAGHRSKRGQVVGQNCCPIASAPSDAGPASAFRRCTSPRLLGRQASPPCVRACSPSPVRWARRPRRVVEGGIWPGRSAYAYPGRHAAGWHQIAPSDLSVEGAEQRRQRLPAEANRRQETILKQALELCRRLLLLTVALAKRLRLSETMVLLRERWQRAVSFRRWKHYGCRKWRTEHGWRTLDAYARLIGVFLQHWLSLVSCCHCSSGPLDARCLSDESTQRCPVSALWSHCLALDLLRWCVWVRYPADGMLLALVPEWPSSRCTGCGHLFLRPGS